MRSLLKVLLFVAALAGVSGAATVTNVYVNQVFLENEAQFRIILSNSTSIWYVVKETDFTAKGADRFHQIHAMCVAALNSNKLVTVNYSGSASPYTLTDIIIKR